MSKHSIGVKRVLDHKFKLMILLNY